MFNLTHLTFISILGLSSSELLADTEQQLEQQLDLQINHLKYQLSQDIKNQSNQSLMLTVMALNSGVGGLRRDAQLAMQGKVSELKNTAE